MAMDKATTVTITVTITVVTTITIVMCLISSPKKDLRTIVKALHQVQDRLPEHGMYLQN